MSKVLIDYFSFSFSPKSLFILKDLARTGAIVKTPRPVGLSKFDGFDSSVNATFIKEISSSIDEAFGNADYLNTSATYRASYTDLISHYGVHLFDALCCAEVELFVECLNNEISIPSSGSDSPRFSYSLRSGGMFGYSYSANLICSGINCGVLAWGAVNGGCYVSISGSGCSSLDFTKLHGIIFDLPGIKITRVDLALDDYSGEVFSVDSISDLALDGAFNGAGPDPKFSLVHSGHIIPNKVGFRSHSFYADSGSTLYVGSRASGKMLRVYEKGRQMNSIEYPHWQRAEVEIRSKDRVIPLDVMLNPDSYFAGSYPVLQQFVLESTPTPIKTFKNVFKSTRDHCLAFASVQAGRLINYLTVVEGISPDSIVRQLTAHLLPEDIPLRLSMPVNYHFLLDCLSGKDKMSPAF